MKNETIEQTKNIYFKFRDKINALNYAFTLIEWDSETIAPDECFDDRGKKIEILSQMLNDLVFNQEYIDSVNDLYQNKNKLDNLLSREIEIEKKNLDNTLKLPKELIVENSVVISKASQAWADAKKQNDFLIFAPYLKQIVEIQRKIISYLETEELKGYDVLLDQYEEGMNIKKYDEFFKLLKQELIPLIKKIEKKKSLYNFDFATKNYPITKQKEFAKYIAKVMCFDYSRGVDSESEHPFTTSTSRNDVRVTNHYYIDLFTSSIFSMIHELGHATFELQIGKKLENTNLAKCSSMALHESQSRFYENIVGRSFEFWNTHYPKLQKTFKKQLENVSLEDFYHYINKVEPSLIRTEADELTYPLHIMIRYDIEQGLLNGTINVDDLPNVWNKAYKEYLGIDVPNDQLGVLQDVHWAGGSFGYFPTYALGSAYSAQLYYKMSSQLDINKAFSDKTLKQINSWLKKNVHQYGDLKKPQEILKLATGEEFNPIYYINYLKDKYTKIYKL